MAKVHITHKSRWDAIRADGFLHCKESQGAPLFGPDCDKVSAFSGVDTSDRDLLRSLRESVAVGKNPGQSPSEFSFPAHEFVILEIPDHLPGVEWQEYPGEKSELVDFMGLSQDTCDRIGEYVKTSQAIPASSLSVIAV